MLTIIYVGLGLLAAVAAGVTIYAVRFAREGYQDDDGFHAGPLPRSAPTPSPAVVRRASTRTDARGVAAREPALTPALR